VGREDPSALLGIMAPAVGWFARRRRQAFGSGMSYISRLEGRSGLRSRARSHGAQVRASPSPAPQERGASLGSALELPGRRPACANEYGTSFPIGPGDASVAPG
jgi:hypothetical protein